MKKLLLATSCIVAIAGGLGSAQAADLPVRRAPMVADPVATWTGAYLGGHVGIARSNGECTPGGDSASYGYYSCGYGAGNSMMNQTTGLTAGVQGGYNWQVAPSFVFGVVADWSWTDLDRTQVNTSYAFKAKVDWLASIRGRAGLAFDRTLLYVTGGVSAGQIKGEGNLNPSFSYPYSPINKTAVGWVAGVGIEHQLAIMPRWSVMAEVLYYDLGRNQGAAALGAAGSSAAGSTYQNEYVFEVFTAKVGLNYRF